MKKTNFKIDKPKLIGIVAGLLIIIISAIMLYLEYIDSKAFYFIFAVSFVIIGMPIFIGLIIEGKIERNVEQMFLEFSRDLVEGVKSGTPINKIIINLKNKDYGSLNPHVIKLANQISIGIPVKDALDIFAKDIKNQVISRSISLIREAERSGGRIEAILESVTFSVNQIEKLKKERKAAIYSLAVQGYIIFLIFIMIMLVMEFKILPITAEINNVNSEDFGEISGGMGGSFNPSGLDIDKISKSFLYLLLVQGFFAGLVIGKISEGNLKAGIKHSFILVALSWLLSTGAELFLK